MNMTTTAEQAALTVPRRAALALGASDYEIKLQELLTNSVRIVAPTNKAARDECHAAYMVLKNARCSIVNLAADATEDAKAFTKAVKTESERLIAITTAEEDRLQGLRDAWDAKVEAEKAAKIAAERARVDAIINLIDDIKSIPAKHAMSDSTAIRSAVDYCKAWVIDVPVFQEFRDKAAVALDDATHALEIMLATVERREQAELAAEEARKAEAARIEQERADLAKQRIEAERIANEQAAERKRLADIAAAQEAANAELRRKAEANLQAERDAQAELLRREREAADAELKRKQDIFNAEQAEFRRQQVIAQDAQRREDDHGPALEMNVQFDAERAAQDPADLERCTATAKAMLSNGRSLMGIACDAGDVGEIEPTYADIAAMGQECGMTLRQWVARLELFVVEAREELARLEGV